METKQTIKQEIKSRETASKGIRKLIQGSSGMERHGHWLDKRSYGYDTRCLLLLYAMLRGKPRCTLERKYGDQVFERYYLSPSLEKLAEKYGLAYTRVEIQTWLWATIPTQEVAA
jgi:hypothetical protein